MKTKTKTSENKKPNPELLRKKQLLIEKFCKPEKINWPKEMVILNRILKNETIELLQFIVLGFRLNSVYWFLTPKGKEEIEKQKKIYNSLQVAAPTEIKNDIVYERTTEKKQSFKDRLLK